ncbi:hypothetical protein JKP88DRAFT_266566 [Tribonema minus]|uniref:Uncharacterized protein n=1 Tax=Tribonema minus TaxID=303371 RepID=A0A835ZED2_9STRA|nr:hypothetical protein JKP88DRAFT_266566 [Tribonema minus]
MHCHRLPRRPAQHLGGEDSRRCPCCFDGVSRERLAPAAPLPLRAPRAGALATFTLLLRDKRDLLLQRLEQEEAELLAFREASLASGDTEWLPYVTEACALLDARRAALVGALPHAAAAPGATPRARPKRAATEGVSPPEVVAAAHKRAAPESCTGGFGGAGGGRGAADSGSSSSSAVNAVDAAASAQATADATAAPLVEAAPTGDTEREAEEASAAEAAAESAAAAAARLPHYAFYQLEDGQCGFLHPLSFVSLLEEHCGGSAERAARGLPETLMARVLEVETFRLTRELRRRYAFLGHLPEHCSISFVELDLTQTLSQQTQDKYGADLQRRHKRRQAAERQAERERREDERRARDREALFSSLRTATVDLSGPPPGSPALPPPQGDAGAPPCTPVRASDSVEVEALRGGGGGGAAASGARSFAGVLGGAPSASDADFPALGNGGSSGGSGGGGGGGGGDFPALGSTSARSGVSPLPRGGGSAVRGAWGRSPPAAFAAAAAAAAADGDDYDEFAWDLRPGEGPAKRGRGRKGLKGSPLVVTNGGQRRRDAWQCL